MVALAKKDFLAPRHDKTIGRYRAYLDIAPPLIVDCDRAFAAVNYLGKFNPSYKWSTKLFTGLAGLVFFGGFVALIWWPWWTPILGVFLGHLLFKSSKQSCADFVFEIVRGNPREKAQLVAAGIVLEEMPANPVSQ